MYALLVLTFLLTVNLSAEANFREDLIQVAGRTFQIDWDKNLALDTPQLVQRPSAAWRTLAVFHVYGKDWRPERYSLWYRVPHPKKRGLLQLGLGDQRQRIAAQIPLSDFLGLYYASKEQQLTLKIDAQELQLSFPALKDEEGRWHQHHMIWPGPLPTEHPPLLADGVVCQQVDERCELSSPSQCHLCAHGFVEVTGEGCIQHNTRICGSGPCGGRQQPACVRGSLWAGEEEKCRDQSTAGFCAEGLQVFCLNDETLSCL